MKSLFLNDADLGCATDLYQLTMAAAYFAHGMTEEASFELFVRRLPPDRGYLVAAGLEQALHYLSHLSYNEEDLRYLQAHASFRLVPAGFFDYLRAFRFTGEVEAIPEGTPVFGNEPLLRVTAPLIQAQIVETYLLSTINFQTLIATKAARIVEAAGGRPVYDFGFRRAHGPGAALLAARASYIGGCAGTSNVLAARELGIPCVGTMAHSWIMAHDRESDAFDRFLEVFPDSILLIDTYDTLEGARLAADRTGTSGVRLDSGDLGALARSVRKTLDAAGRRDCKIIASGDLNEYKIAGLSTGQAPIDAFGVGTEMVTSRDQPALGGVYKLVEQLVGGKRVGRSKRSAEKVTFPWRKQIYRRSIGGRTVEDTVARADESCPGEPLLRPVLGKGKGIQHLPSLPEIRARSLREVSRLPEGVRRTTGPEKFPVSFRASLQEKGESPEP